MDAAVGGGSHGRADSDADAGVPNPVAECYGLIGNEQATEACTNCACEQCTDKVLDCLTRGLSYDNDMCMAAFLCSVRARCTGWDCYCGPGDSSCRRNPTVGGSGPCTDEMDRAAGGDRLLQADAAHLAGRYAGGTHP